MSKIWLLFGILSYRQQLIRSFVRSLNETFVRWAKEDMWARLVWCCVRQPAVWGLVWYYRASSQLSNRHSVLKHIHGCAAVSVGVWHCIAPPTLPPARARTRAGVVSVGAAHDICPEHCCVRCVAAVDCSMWLLLCKDWIFYFLGMVDVIFM